MNPFYKNLALWLVITLLMVLLYNLFNQSPGTDSTLSYTDFLDRVESGQVYEVVIQGQELYVTDDNNQRFKVFAPQDTELISTLRRKGVIITAKPPSEQSWQLATSPWHMARLRASYSPTAPVSTLGTSLPM